MRADWNAHGGLLKVLRDGEVDATLMLDARRDAADSLHTMIQALASIYRSKERDGYHTRQAQNLQKIAGEALCLNGQST